MLEYSRDVVRRSRVCQSIGLAIRPETNAGRRTSPCHIPVPGRLGLDEGFNVDGRDISDVDWGSGAHKRSIRIFEDLKDRLGRDVQRLCRSFLCQDGNSQRSRLVLYLCAIQLP